ncbi:MAG TPA: arylsulfatase, partial [Planctomycetaceae bacterium]|nr:arylsulfatase [Planctomycetaceae bacterium]
IAEVLKAKGYHTACIGKWHLGDQPPFLPTRQGFDYYFGIPYSDDMTPRPGYDWPPLPLMENERVIEAPVDRNLLTKRYTEKTIQFIERHKDVPFFVYLPHAMPGSTRAPFASEAFRGKSANGPYGDSVEELDWSTGQILATLRRLGLDERTLVIWTSDNGAPRRNPPQGSNAPLAGWGYTTMEGGMRVPLIARWPGHIAAGTVCHELATMMDLLPTLAHLAGAQPPTDRLIDGHDIWPLLSGSPNAKTPYEAFFYYFTDRLYAVRSGPWKLHLAIRDARRNTRSGRPMDRLLLYNLRQDIGETKNLAATRPDVVERLLAYAEKARQDLGEGTHRTATCRPAGRVENPRPQ